MYCLQENRTCLFHDLQTILQLWGILHFTSLVSPQEAYSSGNPAESGVSCENQESPLISTALEITKHFTQYLLRYSFIGAIFRVGEGEADFLWMLWLEACHLFSGVHWWAVAQFTFLIFCIILSILTPEQLMAHRIIKTFFSLFSWTTIYSPFVSLKLFYPTLSLNGLTVLVSFMTLNLGYFTSFNKNNKETEEKSPTILPSYCGNCAHFSAFSSTSFPYIYIFYTATMYYVTISLSQAYHISFCSCLRQGQLFFTEACLYLSFLFSFFPFIFISWRLITLQYCSGFCHTLT